MSEQAENSEARAVLKEVLALVDSCCDCVSMAHRATADELHPKIKALGLELDGSDSKAKAPQ